MRLENSAADFLDRWRPFGLVGAVLIAGLFIGMVIALYACSPGSALGGAKEERYYVLAARLYAQGESLEAIKTYLSAAGSRDASQNVTRLAEKYEKSPDDSRRVEARELRQFADGLRAGPGLFSSLGRVPLPSALPSSTPESSPPASPTPLPTPTQGRPSATPTPTVILASAPVTGKGIARPAGGGGAILREQPTTKSNWTASIPTGAKVDVLKVVDGEAVDPAEGRWYQLKYLDKTGYVYFKLIVQGE